MRLKSPKNLRETHHRTCYNCGYGKYDEKGSFFCKRDPDNYLWDVGEMKFVSQVCDRWRGYR